MFTPSKLDSTKKYPIIDYIYPGPQSGSVGPRSFSPARGDHQALAELGFVVVAIDGMGTPGRSKTFARHVLRPHGRQHDSRSGRGHQGARASGTRSSTSRRSASGATPAAASRRRRAMFKFTDFFDVGHRGVGQPRQPQLRGRLGRALSGAARRRTARPTTMRPRRTRRTRRISRAS